MSVKILNLLPVTGDVLTPEMFKYMCKYLEPDTEVQTYQITSGPPSIECEYDEALAAPDVLRLAKQGEEDGFQAIFINCFGDPAVKAAREYVDIPVFGGFEPATHFALYRNMFYMNVLLSETKLPEKITFCIIALGSINCFYIAVEHVTKFINLISKHTIYKGHIILHQFLD